MNERTFVEIVEEINVSKRFNAQRTTLIKLLFLRTWKNLKKIFEDNKYFSPGSPTICVIRLIDISLCDITLDNRIPLDKAPIVVNTQIVIFGLVLFN